MPKVSVIIPTYNREQYLSDAVKSVLNQTYQDFELIIIDDGSTDKTRRLIENFKNNKIKYYYQNNKGVSSSRNVGIKISRGTFICFLDSDDYWLPKKLERQIKFNKTNHDILIHQTEEIWMRKPKKFNSVAALDKTHASAESSKEKPQFHRVNPLKKHTKYAGMIYERCLPLCLITPSSVMIYRSIFDEVGTFDESLPACEDYDLWLRITYKYPVGLIKQKLIIKQGGHNDQLSRTIPSLDRFRIQAMVKMINSNKLSKRQRMATIKELKKKCAIYSNGCIKRGNIEKGKKFLLIPKQFK